MNQRLHFTSITLLGLLYFISAVSIYASDRSSGPKSELVVYFNSTTFKIDPKCIDEIYIKLDQHKHYRIQGYGCSNNNQSEESSLAEAERRAGIVRDLLAKKGFPLNQLATIGYEHSSECKVILITVD